METIEGNKLIAEFMHVPSVIRDIDGTKVYWYTDPEKGYLLSMLKYHSSPNWIWPVIEKIESLSHPHHGKFVVTISGNTCNIQGSNLWISLKFSDYGPVYMSDPNAIFDTKMESVWYNVVKFIEWYNTLQHE